MVAVGLRLPSACHVRTSAYNGRPKAHDVHGLGQSTRASPSFLRRGTLELGRLYAWKCYYLLLKAHAPTGSTLNYKLDALNEQAANIAKV